jgi:tetratricopeptide (TPR) repeat protein
MILQVGVISITVSGVFMRTVVRVLFILFLAGSWNGYAQVTVNAESGKEYKAGLELYNTGKYEQSLTRFQKAFDLDKRNTSALFAHGLALNRLERNREATDDFRRVLAADSTHAKALKMLPAALIASGDTTQAMAAYDRGIVLAPGDAYFYQGKAVVLISDYKYREAIPLLEKASAFEPSNEETTVRLMNAYRESGDQSNAVKLARGVLARNNRHTLALLTVADYERQQGNLKTAMEAYKSASRDIEAKAYAEYNIKMIEQELEEREIDREYEKNRIGK